MRLRRTIQLRRARPLPVVPDHVPLMLDLALTAERTPRSWDEESFAEEIGRRQGPAARDVVEKLVSWADQKERELAAATGVATKALTRFPTNGVTTEPELMFPVDLNLEPRGSQPTISTHADGQVVVWLGGMHHPPFDTEAGREELRRVLNELDGVHIHRRQVKGWPRFPLSVLEDGSARVGCQPPPARSAQAPQNAIAAPLESICDSTVPTSNGLVPTSTVG